MFVCMRMTAAITSRLDAGLALALESGRLEADRDGMLADGRR